MFAPSEADGSSLGLGQTKDYQTGIRCLNANHAALKERAKTGWLGIRIMCRSQNTCQSSECCLWELALSHLTLTKHVVV